MDLRKAEVKVERLEKAKHKLQAKVEQLEKAVRDHENDCACLPEDRSVTETVTSLQAKIERLEVAIMLASKPLGLMSEKDWTEWLKLNSCPKCTREVEDE